MANIFTLENIDDFSEKLNIDDLYEKKRQYDLSKLELYNKILNRVHVRIKTVSRQKIDEQFCWFVVPEVMIGVPKYDNGLCIAYLLDKLRINGFQVKYMHPNTLLISWKHWVPSYVRSELKKKTGIVVDEYGKKVSETSDFNFKLNYINDFDNNNNNNFNNSNSNNNNNNSNNNGNNNSNNNNNPNSNQSHKKYTPINSYKPSGNLVYNQDLLNKIEDTFTT